MELCLETQFLISFLSEDGGIPLGTGIALAGTSGAGKTTLCKKLQKELSSDMNSVFFFFRDKQKFISSPNKKELKLETTHLFVMIKITQHGQSS